MSEYTEESLKWDLKENGYLILFLGVIGVLLAIINHWFGGMVAMLIVLSMLFTLAVGVNLILRFRLLELMIEELKEIK